MKEKQRSQDHCNMIQSILHKSKINDYDMYTGQKNASQYELTGIDIFDANKFIACPTKPYRMEGVGLQIQYLSSCHQ